jgi:hypothetical protein
MKIQDLYPLIADGQIPDYPVEVFADGQPAKLTWKWEFVRQTDEESDEPAEGTNHLRIEVVTEWQPFDFNNLPTPNPDQLLLIVSRYKSGRQVVFHCHYWGNETVWEDYTGKTPDLAFDDCNTEVMEFKMIQL